MMNNIRGDSNTNVGNVSNSYNTFNLGVNEESLQIQAWLSPLEPHQRHHDVSNRRLDGVGDWVLRKNEFESWCGGRDGSGNPTLLCYGGQGVGKTYISSLIIDTLCKQARGQNIAVLSLYCDYQAQKEQTAVNMIGGLLKQVAIRVREIPGQIRSAFEESRQDGGKSLRLPDMAKLFTKTIGSLERVYICFDAVDELLPQHRSEFLRAVREVIQDAPNMRLFLTGRPHIRRELDKHLTKGAHIIHIVADQGDIARYISRKMDEDDDRDSDLMTECLKDEIMKTLAERSSEMFLLVALNIDAILGETSLAKRRAMLQKVATTGVGLENVYAQTLQRIREQKGDRSRLGVEVLMWVSHAERPLRIDELRHALAVEIGKLDLDPDNIRPQDTVLGSCLGLAIVDEETSTIRLIHSTLQEYLSRSGILPNAHKTLSQACLAYLNYEQVNALPTKNIPNLVEMPFLEYSSLYWGTHGKMALSDSAKSLALQLLNRSGDHVSVALLLNKIHRYHSCSLPSHLFPSLHAASYFGIVEVVVALIEMEGSDINQRDCMGLTPLIWAAREGNVEVMRLLLERDCVNLDAPDGDSLTPLDWASCNGHVGAVKMLLSQVSINPDRSDDRGRTPLWWASHSGHEGVVKLLLARDDVNSDKPTNNGKTPLWCAFLGGHEGVVRLLLTRNDVNPNWRDDRGNTPLSWASYSGNEGVVRLLLARNDIDPDKTTTGGETPLWRASFYGNEGVVRLLLARGDVNPDQPDVRGNTALFWACYHGHEEVVRLLLTRNDVDPNKPDEYGSPPLCLASYEGYEEIVRLLLTRHDVDHNRPDKDGQTPLQIASERGYTNIVALLLHRQSTISSLD